METRADEKIRKYSKEKNDQRIMALCTDELIAKEAMYHKTYYRNYTREEYVKKDHYDVFEFVKQFLDKLSTDQKIIMYSELTDAVGLEMKNEGMPDETIMNTKKNLRQRIEQNLIGYNFITIERKMYMYPDSLNVRDAVMEIINLRKTVEIMQQATESEKQLMKAANLIRNEIKSMKDTMPWPPSLSDLDISAVDIGETLSYFMNTLLTGGIREPTSARMIRLKLSIGQDLVYAVSNGKIKTPKSIMYPTVIKSLTNSTLNNKLGHGVSKSILEELFTENALHIIDKQTNEDTLIPHGFLPNKLTIAVHDNIDRLEETLSGK